MPLQFARGLPGGIGDGEWAQCHGVNGVVGCGAEIANYSLFLHTHSIANSRGQKVFVRGQKSLFLIGAVLPYPGRHKSLAADSVKVGTIPHTNRQPWDPMRQNTPPAWQNLQQQHAKHSGMCTARGIQHLTAAFITYGGWGEEILDKPVEPFFHRLRADERATTGGTE